MEARSLILSPEQYTQVSAYDLLCAAEEGFAGIDHRFLHALVDAPEKSIHDIVRFGLEDPEERRAQRGAHHIDELDDDLVNVFRHLRAPEAIPFLIECLRRDKLEASLPLIDAFQAIGAAAVEPLLAFYEESGREEDSDTAFLLASLGVRDPRILETLLARLEVDPVDAGHCLAMYGDKTALPAMGAALESFEGEEWMKRSLAGSISELESGMPATEDEPFDLWAQYPSSTDPRFDLLDENETELFLESSDAENRFAAVSVLSEDQTPSRLYERLLRMAREDPDMRVRGECWEALIEGWDRGEIRKAMRACLTDETASDEERSGALIALASRESDRSDVRRVMLEFYGREKTRASALRAMAIAPDPTFDSYFRESLDDSDVQVVAQAMSGIALRELEADAPRLVDFFQDEELRSEALPCYALSAPCEPTSAELRRLRRKIDELAGGLSFEEDESVKNALNVRAERYELNPLYSEDGEELIEEPVIAKEKVGRNDPCPCGSGKKYKKCCGG
jgi:hypothetical protein